MRASFVRIVGISLALVLSFSVQVLGKSVLTIGPRPAVGTPQAAFLFLPSRSEMFCASPGHGLRFISKQYVDENKRAKYSIKVKYPELPLSTLAARKLNSDIKELLFADIAGFRKNLADFHPNMQMEVGSYYEEDYHITFSSRRLVSIKFEASSYFAGAAHPGSNSWTYNYDLAAGKKLQLSNLFRSHSSYLRTISNYCIRELRKKIGPDADQDWIKRGAGPEPANYTRWNITPYGLEITFDDYQVDSHAQGPQEVMIPYTALRIVIDPFGAIERR